jgi:hypothetical protein
VSDTESCCRKSEDPTEFSNYRSVSVLPFLLWVFERVLQGRLLEFLDQQEVVIPGHYGFGSGHSTAMAVVDMVERVREAWRKKNVARGVFIDLKKAFNTVDHRILLAKLEHYGVRGEALGILGSYLRDRSQYVLYNGRELGRHRVECGVPQGSVLGPLFFLLYVNDMARPTGEMTRTCLQKDRTRLGCLRGWMGRYLSLEGDSGVIGLL